MTIGLRILAASMLVLLPACEQGTTSRSKTALLSGGTQSLQFELIGEFKPETVRGYLLEHQELVAVPDVSPLFKIDNVENGIYKLWVFAESKDGKKLASEQVFSDYRKGQQKKTVALADGATVSGSIIGDEAVVKTLTLSILGSDFTTSPDANLAFSFTGLPATEMTLLVTDSKGTQVFSNQIITESGKSTSVAIDLAKIGDITSDPSSGDSPVSPETPVTKLTGGALVLNGGQYKANSLTLPVTFVTPTGASEILISEDIALVGEWIPIPSSYNHTFAGTGQQTLYAKYRSKGGIESEKVYASVDINTTVPSPGTVKLTSGSTYTKNRNVSFTITAFAVTKMKFALSQAALQAATFGTYAPVFSNFDLGDDLAGVHKVWFQFQSDYGISGPQQSVDINVVKTGPAVASFVTKTGASYFRAKDILFTVTPGTMPFDVAFYQASCDNVKFKRAAFSTASPDILLDVTSSLMGCLTTEGSRTVSVYLEDSLGNVGTAMSTAVTFDVTPPGMPTIDQTTGTYTQNASFTVSGTAEADATITISGGTTPVTVTADGTGIYTSSITLNANAINTVVVKATDAAGNNSFTSSITATHDSVVPSITDGPYLRLTSDTMRLTFDTSEEVAVVVDYGLTAAYGLQEIDATFQDSHNILITGFDENTVYHYQITITDRAGNAFSTTDASARTYIDKSSILLTSEVWDQTTTPFYISGNFRIDPGLTVRIKKGVTIVMDSATQIWVRGNLIAEGTASEPITFTSNNPQPVKGDWDNIEFNNLASVSYSDDYIYDSGSKLDHVIVQYGGSNGQAILIRQKSMSITNSTIKNNKDYALTVEDRFGEGTVSIRNNIFEDNEAGIKTFLTDELIFGQKVFVSNNIFKNNTGRAMDLKTFNSVTVERNQFLSNVSGFFLASLNATVDNNIFNNTPNTFTLEPESTTALALTARKNSILASTALNETILSDSATLSGASKIYSISFSENTVHNNKVLTTGDSLILLDHPDTYSVTDPLPGPVSFTNNNFINNSVGVSGVYTMMTKSKREHADIAAQNNYWGNSNEVTVHQTYIYDYTDFNTYRGIAHAPVLIAHRESAPISPPRNLTVTSPAAGTADISWTLNGEADTGGYFIYYSTTANSPLLGTGAVQGVSKIDTEGGAVSCSTVSTTKTCTLTGLTPAQTYYFTVTAYDGGDKAVKNFSEPGPANTGTDIINIVGHGFRDGQRVRMGTGIGGVLPTGLNATTNYWITYVDANNIKLRTTPSPGVDVDITVAGNLTCKIIPNLPFKTLDHVANSAAVNITSDHLTFAGHGFNNGMRGKITGSYLGIDTTTEYFVSKLDANTYVLSTEAAGVSHLDIGLNGGYKIISQDIDFSSDTFSVQNHRMPDGTEVQFTTTGTLPSPLTTLTNYYVVNSSSNTFQLSDLLAGAPVDLIDPANTDSYTITPTTPGSGAITFTPNYPDITRQDFQYLGNESWYAPEVATAIQ